MAPNGYSLRAMPFRVPDSYDALAASIERALRADLPRGTAAEFAGSIDRALLDAARAGELTLAYLRLVVIATFLAPIIAALASPSRLGWPYASAGSLVFGLAWAVVAVTLVAVLRRGWYRLWLRFAMPAVDALMIWSSFLVAWRHAGSGGIQAITGALAYVTALCGFLAVSGALRLSRSSAQLSAALATAVFLFAAAASDVAVVPDLAIAATLLVTGILSASAPTLVRRAVTNEVGRVALSRLYEEAQQTIDAREEVLKVVSHDLRNPLHTIAMSTQLMLELPLPDEKRAKQLTMIKRAGERMNRMVQDLLDVAKMEAGRLAVTMRPVDLSTLLAEAKEMLQPLAAEQSLRLDVHVAGSLADVNADAGRILQVLSNLVGNAIKFTPAGGCITIAAQSVAGHVRIAVTDTGAGIPREQLPHIFGRFWQADRGDRRGIGLGLAIAKGIVEAHGGRIWVESKVGEGTTFYFTLGESRSDASDPRVSGARAERPVARR